MGSMRGLVITLVCISASAWLQGGVTALWWADRGLVQLDEERVCHKSGRLGAKQASICKKEPELIRQMAEGVQWAVEECQFQFTDRPWNCTTQRAPLAKFLRRDTRELAYLRAVTSAGAMHGVTEACAKGLLLQCSCDNSVREPPTGLQGDSPPGDPAAIGGGTYRGETAVAAAPAAAAEVFRLSGCRDHIGFAYTRSKEFVDVDRQKSGNDFLVQVDLHNCEAGRLASQRYVGVACKCHGLSGTCTLRTCWPKLPPLATVAQRLRDRYDGAIEVMSSNGAGVGILSAAGEQYKQREPEDLIFSQSSLNYCKARPGKGILGTRGRVCDPRSDSVGGCQILCCNRGYRQTREVVVENCRCKFIWCCEIVCSTCVRNVTVYTCK